MIIRKKEDIRKWITDFTSYASYDMNGQKHYYTLDDRKRNGIWTLMRYSDGVFTIHGKGEGYCDEGEVYKNKDEIVQFLWDNRGALNASLQKKIA